MRRTASFDVLSVKIGLTDSPVGERKNQKKKSVVNFEHGGVYISPIWGAKTPGRIEPKFLLVIDVHDIITPFKFGDDRFRGFGLAGGLICLFP